MAFHKRISFWIFAVAAVIALFFVARKYLERIEVKGYEIRKQDLTLTVTATSTGTVKADKEVKISAQRIGTINKLFVEEGSIVKKGEPIAEMESDEPLQKLNASSAALQKLELTLQSLRLNLNSFRTDIESNVAKTSSILNETENKFKRFNELKEKGYISQNEFDALKREYDVAKANHASALAAREQIRAKEDDIKAQEKAVQQARSETGIARINYDYSFIRTPISGVVTARPVKVGETVIVGAHIANVVSTDSLYIEALIDEADVAKVSLGHPVNVGIDAYPEQTFKGEVYMISPVVLGGKQEARTFEIRVKLLDRKITVKPGMSADVEVVVDMFRDVLVVPSQAIIEKNEGKFVYAVRNGKAAMTQVKTGHFNWHYTEITEGLKEGDVVVTNIDVPKFSDGVRVKVVKSGK